MMTGKGKPEANRVDAILSIKDENERDQRYWKLYHELHPSCGNSPRLDWEDTVKVLAFLVRRKLSIRERVWLWRLLLFGTRVPSVYEYAKSRLEDDEEESIIRGLAFETVQRSKREPIPELVARYREDKSPHVRYCVACTIEDAELRRTLLESILRSRRSMDHELYDSIQIDLAEIKSSRIQKAP